MPCELGQRISDSGFDQDFAAAFVHSLGDFDPDWLVEFDEDPTYWRKDHIYPEFLSLSAIAQFSSNERYVIFMRKNGLNAYLLLFDRLREIYGVNFAPLTEKFRAMHRSTILTDHNATGCYFDLDSWWAKDPEVGDAILREFENRNYEQRRHLRIPAIYTKRRYNERIGMPIAAAVKRFFANLPQRAPDATQDLDSTKKSLEEIWAEVHLTPSYRITGNYALAKVLEKTQITNMNAASYCANVLSKKGLRKCIQPILGLDFRSTSTSLGLALLARRGISDPAMHSQLLNFSASGHQQAKKI